MPRPNKRKYPEIIEMPTKLCPLIALSLPILFKKKLPSNPAAGFKNLKLIRSTIKYLVDGMEKSKIMIDEIKQLKTNTLT
tara:strand:- start:361 stop:600 length:240 start_codon:yes stop_codon:yes gene_type:complete